MNAEPHEALRLRNQLCFPLYSVANLIIRNYKPLLDALGLTYTQYVVMMALWEQRSLTEKELSIATYLQSNTLALLLRKLEKKGYVDIRKNESDHRSIRISLTPLGEELEDKAVCVPPSIAKTIDLTPEEALFLHKILYKILKETA